jgi:hypothetical protein
MKNYINQTLMYFILFVIIVTSFALRYPLVKYNLPVCAGIDERIGLQALCNFENVSLNPNLPDYPIYPAVYYYTTFFLMKIIGVNNTGDFLLYGRIINLLFGCALAVSVFFLSKQIFGSYTSSLIAAAFTMFSPIIIHDDSYIVVNTLMALLSMISLLFFDMFFKRNEYKYWFLGVLFTGLAISTKQNAFLIFVSYAIIEFIRSGNPDSSPTVSRQYLSFLNKRFPSRIFPFLFLGLGLLALMFYIFFPIKMIMSIVQTQGGVDSVIDAADVQFIKSIRVMLLYIGIAVLFLSLISYRFNKFFERFCIFRPYIAFAIIMLVFFLGSPYMLIDWKRSLYNLGSFMKLITTPMRNENQQWFTYFSFYFHLESIVILLFFFIGVFRSIQLKVDIRLLILYLIINYINIGPSKMAFPRYLVPILLVIFMISAWGIYSLGSYIGQRRKRLTYVFLIISIALIGFELYPKVHSAISYSANTDEMYESYVFVNKLHPHKVYYSGVAPNVELKIENIEVKEIPKRWLADNDSPFLQTINKNEILIVDKKSNEIMNELLRKNLKLLLSSDKGYGQYIFSKS